MDLHGVGAAGALDFGPTAGTWPGSPTATRSAPREILTVATGPVVMLAEELGRTDGIESAFLYGSFAARMPGDPGPAPHDIDVMVLGELDADAVYEACTRVEAAVHRPVNPAILTPEEFAAPSGFLNSLRSGPAVAVIGELPWR